MSQGNNELDAEQLAAMVPILQAGLRAQWDAPAGQPSLNPFAAFDPLDGAIRDPMGGMLHAWANIARSEFDANSAVRIAPYVRELVDLAIDKIFDNLLEILDFAAEHLDDNIQEAMAQFIGTGHASASTGLVAPQIIDILPTILDVRISLAAEQDSAEDTAPELSWSQQAAAVCLAEIAATQALLPADETDRDLPRSLLPAILRTVNAAQASFHRLTLFRAGFTLLDVARYIEQDPTNRERVEHGREGGKKRHAESNQLKERVLELDRSTHRPKNRSKQDTARRIYAYLKEQEGCIDARGQPFLNNADVPDQFRRWIREDRKRSTDPS